MRRPSHRRNDPQWCPGPRSRWARSAFGIARHFPKPFHAELLAIIECFTDNLSPTSKVVTKIAFFISSV